MVISIVEGAIYLHGWHGCARKEVQIVDFSQDNPITGHILSRGYDKIGFNSLQTVSARLKTVKTRIHNAH